jgi:hypothetical protein
MLNTQIQNELSRLDLNDPIDNAIAEGLLMAKNIIERNTHPITSCTTCPLHSTMELYERCGYPNHEQHGTNLFNQCPIITVGAILITHEKQTS